MSHNIISVPIQAGTSFPLLLQLQVSSFWVFIFLSLCCFKQWCLPQLFYTFGFPELQMLLGGSTTKEHSVFTPRQKLLEKSSQWRSNFKAQSNTSISNGLIRSKKISQLFQEPFKTDQMYSILFHLHVLLWMISQIQHKVLKKLGPLILQQLALYAPGLSS